MLANTTGFGEADVIAVMRHYFTKTSTFHGDFGTYFSALTPVFSEHTSSLASDLPWQLVTLAISDTFSTKPPFSPIILKQTQAINSKRKLKQTKPSRRF